MLAMLCSAVLRLMSFAVLCLVAHLARMYVLSISLLFHTSDCNSYLNTCTACSHGVVFNETITVSDEAVPARNRSFLSDPDMYLNLAGGKLANFFASQSGYPTTLSSLRPHLLQNL